MKVATLIVCLEDSPTPQEETQMNKMLFSTLMVLALICTATIVYADTYPGCIMTGDQSILITSYSKNKAEVVKSMCQTGQNAGYIVTYEEDLKPVNSRDFDVEIQVGDRNDNKRTSFRLGRDSKSAHYVYNDIEAIYGFELLTSR